MGFVVKYGHILIFCIYKETTERPVNNYIDFLYYLVYFFVLQHCISFARFIFFMHRINLYIYFQASNFSAVVSQKMEQAKSTAYTRIPGLNRDKCFTLLVVDDANTGKH